MRPSAIRYTGYCSWLAITGPNRLSSLYNALTESKMSLLNSTVHTSASSGVRTYEYRDNGSAAELDTRNAGDMSPI